VTPPTTTIANTSAQQATSHPAIARDEALPTSARRGMTSIDALAEG